MKQSVGLFCDFLEDLDFGDELGLVTYDTSSRIETRTGEDAASVNLGSNLITNNYQDINTIQQQRQAGHYSNYTGMGYGINSARQLLENHARFGARRTMVLMTDGLTNQRPAGWNLPTGWDWSQWSDFNGDGIADFTTSDQNRQYAFYEATLAISQGYTIHTVGVGIGADNALLEAIAKAAGGIAINVPGGASVGEMQEQLLAAFSKIAARVPPPKLVYGQ